MLKFTGVGSAFNLQDGSNSAYFIKGESLYIIDCGESVFVRMAKSMNFTRFTSITILITHMHNDHIGSIGGMISYLNLVCNMSVTIVHPNASLWQLVELMGVEESMYNRVTTTHYIDTKIAVQFWETQHVENMHCYGLEIVDEETRLYFSGDANSIPPEILERFLAGWIEILYQDITIKPKHRKSHMLIDNIVKKIPYPYRRRVYAMHLDYGSEHEILDYGFQIAKIE